MPKNLARFVLPLCASCLVGSPFFVAQALSEPQGVVGLIWEDPASLPALAALTRELAQPFDTLRLSNGRTVKVAPLADFPGQPPSFAGVWSCTSVGKPSETVEFTKGDLLSVDYFEWHALRKIDALLDAKGDDFKDIAKSQRYVVAEQLASALLSFHFAGRRHAPLATSPWREIQTAAEERLIKARRGILEDLAEAAAAKKDWRRAINQADAWGFVDHARSLSLAFARDRLAALDFAALRGVVNKLEDTAIQMRDAEPFRTALRDRAELLFKQAKEASASQALTKLEEALSLWPGLPGARDELARRTRNYRVLYVAVPELPEALSPATAWTDTEKQVVELLFESLVRVRLDDGLGQSYRPALALALPSDTGLSRRLSLLRDAYWSDGERLTSVDVRHTVQLLTSGDMVSRNSVWRELLEPLRFEGNPFEVIFSARQGLFDPLSPLTFKILPQQFRGKPLARADDLEFSKAPVGSGPFVYSGRRSAEGRTYAVFQANPAFVRTGRPWTSGIREIRLFAWSDPAKELGLPEPHLVLGLEAGQLAALAKQGYSDIRRQSTRRVYTLAFNHRQSALRNVNLRRAIAHAIDRERTLDLAFRGPVDKKTPAKLHHSANGPFPVNSWASCPPTRVPEELWQPELARSFAKKAAAELGDRRLTLKYPNSPSVKTACEAIVKQLEKVFADQPAKIEFMLAPLSTQQMRVAIQQRDFDLAYHFIDYPDDNYWLWPLFDPHETAVRPGGSNYLDYENDAKLQNLLRSAMATRQFSSLRDLSHSIHAHLIDRMPLAPLWQLHDHIAVHPSIRPVGLEPLGVFSNLLEWKWNP